MLILLTKNSTCKEVAVQTSCFISDLLSYTIYLATRMSMFYGMTTEFGKAKEDWVSYVERMRLFFEVHRIEKETKKDYLVIKCWITEIEATMVQFYRICCKQIRL